MSLIFNDFVSTIHQNFSDKVTIEEARDILDIGDLFNRDTPISTGKRLIIKKIAFTGIKTTEDNNSYAGQTIGYEQTISTGINIWIADNLKGKSSIFKLLKYALTGANSIKPNIKKWIHSITINFSISDKEYTIYMDTKSRLKSRLYHGRIEHVKDLEDNSNNILFSCSSETEYQEKIQDFFFKQFGYYALKWTQKSSQKDSNELYESSTSWKTYFKSIFLESSDSAVMFGDQGKKIFQMLLGLQLTYPINHYTVERDKLMFEKATQASLTIQGSKIELKKRDSLEKRLKEIENSLLVISQKTQSSINLNSLYSEHDNLVKLLQDENRKLLILDSRISEEKSALVILERKYEYRLSEVQRIKKEITKVQRNISDLKEYLEVGIFFSNLDIKQCPSCSNPVTETKKKKAVNDKVCSLCNDHLVVDDESENKEEYEKKIENLNIILLNYQRDLLKFDLDEDRVEYDHRNSILLALEEKKSNLSNMEKSRSRLEEINKIFELEKMNSVPDESEKDKLIAEKAVITFQLQHHGSPVIHQMSTDDDIKIEILTSAINELNQQRYTVGANVISRLTELMLIEIRNMGLISISEIEINEKFDIKYKQDGEFIEFEQIAEGEQLRTKIALYLSLIQLDIEFNFGRHTRFLIIDSPAKEEADANYMNGLSSLLGLIEQKFGTELQILIGTAERSLIGAVPQEIITPENEFVF